MQHHHHAGEAQQDQRIELGLIRFLALEERHRVEHGQRPDQHQDERDEQPETVDAIKLTFPPNRELLFPWPHCDRHFSNMFTQIVKAAGIRPGTLKWLRRASATAVEAEQPGAAMAHLGHRTPGLAYQSYVDPRQLGFNRASPPKLTENVGLDHVQPEGGAA